MMKPGSCYWVKCAWLAMLLCGTACGSKNVDSQSLLFDDKFISVAPVSHDVSIKRTRVGRIARAKLLDTLDRGVGRFLEMVEVEPHWEGTQFRGWEIVHIDNQWIDLLPGDVVTSVNGKRIEKPGQVQALWLSLRRTTEIVILAHRGMSSFTLRFEVEGNSEK